HAIQIGSHGQPSQRKQQLPTKLALTDPQGHTPKTIYIPQATRTWNQVTQLIHIFPFVPPYTHKHTHTHTHTHIRAVSVKRCLPQSLPPHPSGVIKWGARQTKAKCRETSRLINTPNEMNY